MGPSRPKRVVGSSGPTEVWMDDKRDKTGISGQQRIERRTTIKGLGALALSAHALPLIACTEQSSAATPTGTMQNPMIPDIAAGPDTSAPIAADSQPSTASTTSVTTSSGDAPMGSEAIGNESMDSTSMDSTSMASAGQSDPMPPEQVAGQMPDTAGEQASQQPPASGMETASPDTMPPTVDAMPPMPEFDEVNSCELTPIDPAREGPFFVHEDEVMNDLNLFRQDLRDGHDGVELRLNLRMLEIREDCMTPIQGVEVYVWHTNALGFYSGFEGQNPDQPYSGCFECTPGNDDRFCRGAQVTDENGVVSFTTLYPGWYNGRPIHIHFLSLRPGSGPTTMSYRDAQYAVLTTQMYFEADFSRMILEGYAPYNTRASGQGYESSLTPGTDVRPTTRMEGDVVVASLNVITNSDEARGVPSGSGFGGPFGP